MPRNSFMPYFNFQTSRHFFENIKHILDKTESNIRFIASNKVPVILFCMGMLGWMLDEVKSNKSFIIPKTLVQVTPYSCYT